MLVVVGGHSRNIGKTSAVVSLIRSLPEWNWTAIKITQYGHGICSPAGESCECAVEYDHPYAATEERDAGSGTDTGRFLAAGARRSVWIRTAAGQLGHALPSIREYCASAQNVVLESNSVLQFLKPDLHLMVLDFANSDFKTSCLTHLSRADAVLISNSKGRPDWHGIAPQLWITKPKFSIEPPSFWSERVTSFVRQKLASGEDDLPDLSTT